LQPTATVKRNQVWETIPATLLVPGDTILLSSGVNVPADCRINNPTPAYIDVDQSNITGESLPITFYKGDSCKMGSTVVRGEVEVTLKTLYRVVAVGHLVRCMVCCFRELVHHF
jgi:H+-transporting ATPase